MYFKVLRETETGQKFQAISDKMDLALKEAKAFADKYKFSKFRSGNWVAYGGISSCVCFEKQPDKKYWKEIRSGEYRPKCNTKIGKAIDQEIENLTSVSVYELNSCVGYEENDFNSISFARKDKKYFTFKLQEDWNHTPPSDCIEITVSEYLKLKN